MTSMYKACGKYFNTLKDAASYSAKHGIYGSRATHALAKARINEKKKDS